MKIRKLKRRIALITIFSFIASVSPLSIAVISKWSDYIKLPSDAIRLSIGGLIVVVLILLKAIGRLKLPQKRVILYLFLLVLCYTLSAILNDLVFLLGMATLGEIIDLIFFQRPLIKLRERLQLEKTSNVVGDKLESIIQKFLGGEA